MLPHNFYKFTASSNFVCVSLAQKETLPGQLLSICCRRSFVRPLDLERDLSVCILKVFIRVYQAQMIWYLVCVATRGFCFEVSNFNEWKWSCGFVFWFNCRMKSLRKITVVNLQKKTDYILIVVFTYMFFFGAREIVVFVSFLSKKAGNEWQPYAIGPAKTQNESLELTVYGTGSLASLSNVMRMRKWSKLIFLYRSIFLQTWFRQ